VAAPLAKESNVLVTGGLLVCAALLTLAALAPLFRSDDPPRWATHRWVGEIFTLTIVCALALGLAFLGAGTIDAFQSSPDYVDLGLLVGVVLLTWVIWRGLKARARRAAPEAAPGLRGDAPESESAPVGGGPLVASERPPPHQPA
jgi:hypothetical protein